MKRLPWNEVEAHLLGEARLPLQGRSERLHLYKWIFEEEEYVAGKFDNQRDDHDQSMSTYELEDFWIPQIVQYYDRACQFFRGAKIMRSEGEADSARHLEMKGQQALAKAMMTAKGCVESSIRCFGNMPMPGVTSGDVREWEYE